MLSALQIKNFKIWKDTGEIRMAPITLFFGANSSGKSSIGQFLMMLKQTVESPDRKAVLYPGGRNTAVQLGSFQEMVFHRAAENKMFFQYQWDLSETLKIKDPVSGQSFSGNELSFQGEVGLEDKNNKTLILDYLRYKLIENGKEKASIGMKRNKGTKKEYYTVEAEKYNLKRKQGRVWYPGDPVRFYGFPDEVVAYHQNADFVQALNLQHEKLFRSIFYLGPFRTKAERLYSWTGIEPESVGYNGENTVAAILAARNRKISLGYRRFAKPFEEILALKLEEMGLIEEFKVKPISEQRQEYEVKVRTRGSRDWVDLPDVGFGVSQVIPVLVQCFYAPAESIILMEQPEIHLHPKAQSVLADVMIDVINSRENGQDRKIQLVIETHSEHFLRRLQRRIAEDAVPKEKVSAYFANVNRAPAVLEPLQIDEYGSIKNWPADFFGDEMEDITEKAKAAMKKRMIEISKTTTEEA
jgi:predicted ATPase